jgi:hypothetical protein
MNNNLKEIVANLVHKIWARWMIYLFDQCYINKKGDYCIPLEFVSRWKKQIHTPYKDLSEPEKESDRRIAKEYIDLFNNYKAEDIYSMKLGETIRTKIIPEHMTYIHRVHKGWIYVSILYPTNDISSTVFVPKDN